MSLDAKSPKNLFVVFSPAFWRHGGKKQLTRQDNWKDKQLYKIDITSPKNASRCGRSCS